MNEEQSLRVDEDNGPELNFSTLGGKVSTVWSR